MIDSDISAGRLPAAELAANFADAHPPLTADQAIVESSRCYFCHDAPCIEACPTGIDIPGFIRKIGSGNLRGSAETILRANIFGGACARVCPTEILCEQACVRTAQEDRPIAIGALQRHAVDWLMAHGIQPFRRAGATGRRVAVVGGGPAGLACAHALAVLGHDITVFEAKPRLGGLNEYGIAAYKLPGDTAQREIDFLLSIGGITVRTACQLGRDIFLPALRQDFDAVFLGLGHAGVNALGAEGETLAGVRDAVAFIAELRQARDKATVAVGARVVVIGGGNTAIDAAMQARRLGADEVTILYRRGPAQMSATRWEQEWAQTSGIRIRHWAAPTRLIGDGGVLSAVEITRTALDAGGRLQMVGPVEKLPADMVLKAVGQHFLADEADTIRLDNGRIAVDAERRTSLPNVFAGGDCIAGADLTVVAVQDGKIAAAAIHRQLTGGDNG